jgi:chromosomal replication initiation ATPase DnaA
MNNNEFLNKKREKEINNDNKYTTEIKKQQNEEKEENKIDIKNIIDKSFDNFISGNNNEFLKYYNILINNLN